MNNFKKLILALELNEYDKITFLHNCRTWEGFTQALTEYNKLQTLKLIKYFITERPAAKRMLNRAITRFNSLNKLTIGDLK